MKKILLLVSVLLVSACATVDSTPQATGGSKADGTVNMSYEVGEFQQPVIDWSSIEGEAVRRCKAWGYKKAEKFGGSTRECIQPGGWNGCAITRHTHAYQCLK